MTMLPHADEVYDGYRLIDNYDFAKAGGGGYWKTINELVDSQSVKQINPLACGAACGEMVLRDQGIYISQTTLLELTGAPTDVRQLAKALNQYNNGWNGAFLDLDEPIEFVTHLNSKDSPWIAQMKGVRIDHFVVVDGFDRIGNIMIRDPYHGTSYTMYIDEFFTYWKEAAVWK